MNDLNMETKYQGDNTVVDAPKASLYLHFPIE